MQLTDKTFVVVMMNDLQIYITEQQANKLKQVLTGSSPKFIDVDGELINTNSILAISKASSVKEKSRIKRGEWECEFGHWHTRGEECGHMLQDNT